MADDVLAPWQERTSGADPGAAPSVAATTTREAVEATSELVAQRGRASYTGERRKGSAVDAGAMAPAVIIERITHMWQTEGVS